MPIAYPLRIKLRHFKPVIQPVHPLAIDRDVLVKPTAPLPPLHPFIQAAMGWEGVRV